VWSGDVMTGSAVSVGNAISGLVMSGPAISTSMSYLPEAAPLKLNNLSKYLSLLFFSAE
jgi:hypothetical protein